MSSAAQKRKLKRTIRSYFAYFEEEYVPESLSKTKLMEWLTPKMRNDFDDFDPLVQYFLKNCLMECSDRVIGPSHLPVGRHRKNYKRHDVVPVQGYHRVVDAFSGQVIRMDHDRNELLSSSHEDLVEYFSDLSYFKNQAVPVEGIVDVEEMVGLNDASKIRIASTAVTASDMPRLEAVLQAGLPDIESKPVLAWLLMAEQRRTNSYNATELIDLLCGKYGMKFTLGGVERLMHILPRTENLEALIKLIQYKAFRGTLDQYQVIREDVQSDQGFDVDERAKGK